ncbi:MAG: serine/threonine protein kinase [Betaproteobacteria bacterium]|nr:MAG: serine/threonine protein kinase [Betaproteobacteria bacterium]
MSLDDPSAASASSPDPHPGGEVFNALPPGYRLLEYSLQSVLGYGGFGITYLATDHNLDCKVAIKEYLPADQAVRAESHSLQPRSTDAAECYQWGLSRFLDEARALATFRHANIVRVLRFFEANGTAYMVMELVSGRPLGQWVKRNQPVREKQLLGVIRPVLEGLAVIHAAGFLHRDIKPSNIHMRSDLDPVLLDFGAARRVMNDPGRELTTVVTPGYAALEQYHSHGNQGPWTDLYSVAAVMYYIVTGQRPIEAPARVHNDPLPRAVDVGDRKLYSDALLRAIDWGLHPDESKRPASVNAYAQTLAEISEAAGEATSGIKHGSPRSESSLPSNPVYADASVMATLETALSSHLGPMAPVLVRRAAKTYASLEALRAALSLEIDSERSRRLFLDRTEPLLRKEAASQPRSAPAAQREPSQPLSLPPASAAPKFDPAFLSKVESELAHHLGPLARVLVKKSAEKARDRAELFLLLSDNIADPDQRRAFIKKSVAAFRDKD